MKTMPLMLTESNVDNDGIKQRFASKALFKIETLFLTMRECQTCPVPSFHSLFLSFGFFPPSYWKKLSMRMKKLAKQTPNKIRLN